jgi:hypothetical protein
MALTTDSAGELAGAASRPTDSAGELAGAASRPADSAGELARAASRPADGGVAVKALRGLYWPAGVVREAGEEFTVAAAKDAKMLASWGKVEILP